MRRELFSFKTNVVCWCCPSHDAFPNESYKNRRSKKARSRDKKIEHRYIRRVLNSKIRTGEDE